MTEENIHIDKEKVQVILDAAQKRFAYFGLAKTTMSEIAADVSLSKASLYYYFTDKDTLFRAVVKREQDGFIAQMQQLILADDTAQNKLVKYVADRHQYFLKIYMNLGQLKMTMDTVKPLLGNLLDAFFNAEIQLVSSILNEGIAKSEFENIDVAIHSDLFISTMNGLRMITIKNKDNYMLEESDYEQIKNRVANLSTVFIKGILRK